MIAVAGATGSVGRWAVRELTRIGIGPLRLGGRRHDTLAAVAQNAPGADITVMDLDDPAGVAAFCAGAGVVLNCAGPSTLILDTLARPALAAGAAYVDVSGDEPVHRRLTATATPGTAVLSAGMLPGLSALLPRWAANGLDRVGSVSCYVGGLERCSPSSAADMILSMHAGDGEDYGEALAGWRQGRVVSRCLRPEHDVEVAFLPDPVSLHPFLSGESARLAAALGADRLDFWNVFVGDRLVTAFTRLRGRAPRGAELDAAVVELTRAAELDLFGREPYYALVVEVTGERDGADVVCSAVLRTSDAYALIAGTAVEAVRAVVAGEVGAGVHFAAEVFDPDRTLRRLSEGAGVSALERVERPAAVAATEEGAL